MLKWFRFRKSAPSKPNAGTPVRATTAQRPADTLLELANRSDSLLALEVRRGCFGEVEQLLVPFGEGIRRYRGSYRDAAADHGAAERVCINLLRLGLFDELRYMLAQGQLPISPELVRFIEYSAEEFKRCSQRGNAYRARHGDGDIFTFGCIVWGAEYIGNFLAFNLRSMLAPGNIPRLRDRGRIVFSIVTDAEGEAAIRRDPVFIELSAYADAEFIRIPDEVLAILRSGHLVRNFYVFYGMLDHCSIYFAQGAKSHLFMIPVDSIVADGTFPSMDDYRTEGFECCGGGNIVANTETFLPALREKFGSDGHLSITTVDLASLAVEHAHHYFTSQIIAQDNVDFGKHPRELFWPVKGGVEIHSVFIHPLFTAHSALARYRRMHFANIDYGMIPRMFDSSEKIRAMDPEKAYVNNFTAAARLYETTGQPFSVDDFLHCHDWSYPVQKELFLQGQSLPCRLEGREAYRDLEADVLDISRGLARASAAPNALSVPSQLTIVLPTRDRPHLCRRQLRMLTRAGLRHRVIVADSSEHPDPSLVKQCTGLIEHLAMPADTTADAKFAKVAEIVRTPFMAILPDDDRTFLHAIESCYEFLLSRPDHVAAQGYVLNAHMEDVDIDVYSAEWFVAGLSEEEPLRRLYELMRRYQPIFWAVFRTDCFRKAMSAAEAATGIIFKELSFVSTVAILGKTGRVPVVHTLRGQEPSMSGLSESHPFYWFLKDTSSFVSSYETYRTYLAHLLEETGGAGGSGTRGSESAKRLSNPAPGLADRKMLQLLDLIHLTYLGREVDLGIVNHTVRLLLGDELESVVPPGKGPRGEADPARDVIHGLGGGRAIWRHQLVAPTAEAEVRVSKAEMARVEAALEDYGSNSDEWVVEEVQGPLPVCASANSTVFENVEVRPVQGGLRLSEMTCHGLHRVLLRTAGIERPSTVTAKLVLYPEGCSKVRIELHGPEAQGYVRSDFDLVANAAASPTEGCLDPQVSVDGDARVVTLAAKLEPGNYVCLTVAMLSPGGTISYAGRSSRSLRVLSISIT